MSEQSKHFKDVAKYCRDIIRGRIKSGMYTKKAVRRFLSDIKRQDDEGFPYELICEKADDVIDFAESLIIPDMPTDDKKLVLLPWMKFIYYNVFGWVYKDDNDRRRFRSGYIEVARKNSKTTSILFPFILYDFLTTESAESYFVSKDKEQSEKAFKELKHIIKADPDLESAISDTVSTITYEHSRIAFFSSESEGIDSYKNSLSVIDEFHAYGNDKVVTAFRYGGRARKNNLTLIITSAGLDISLPCYTENEKAKKILNGFLTDDTYFTVVYAYDEKDKWDDPKNFIKANPSLGAILKPDVLINDLTDALNTPPHQPDFKSKTCGIWTNGTSGWIDLATWDKNKPKRKVNFDTFTGQDAYGAIDLSSVDDFTAYTLCFYLGGKFYLKHRFYIPEETVYRRYRNENVNIPEWINKGYITQTPGQTIDYEYVFNNIISDAQLYRIKEIPFDRWHTNKYIEDFIKKLQHTTFIDYGQSLKQMSQPVKDFEKAVKDGKIVDDNPVMAWMITNAVVKPDANNNYKPLKEYKSSTRRIDGVITSIMAHNRCSLNIRPHRKDIGRLVSLLG